MKILNIYILIWRKNMKCKWSSNINEKCICKYDADESGYCIFHKKNKSKEEKCR